MDTDTPSAADLLGPWKETNYESGLVGRCKEAWSKPLQELTNLELATFLDQNIAADRVLPIAQIRIANNVDDDSEYYEGQLEGSVERAQRRVG